MHPTNKRILRPIATIILLFFTWSCIEPWNYAVWAQGTSSQPSATSNQGSASKRFEEALRASKEAIEDLDQDLSLGKDITKTLESLKGYKKTLEAEDLEIRSEFSQTGAFLKEKGLPSAILDRHAKAVSDYESNYNQLKANLDSISRLDSEQKDAEKKKDKTKAKKKVAELKEKIKSTKDHLKEKVKEPPHTPLDPNNLPHRTPKIKSRKPRLKKEEFAGLQNPIQLAFNGDPSDLLFVQSTQDLPIAADLAETIEVQFTQEIKDLAASLNHNPVKIYNWVRNNIDFVPTYGSIQGANMCLMTKQCNDMDTASLLIALLRTSGISARYVIGTIEVPIDKVMNWVGGFTDAEAALDFISSGGTPVTSIISGGKISSAQIEHAWVEAYVDYIPSRGAVHKQGDTWIPMDGSFKQYAYKSGMDMYKTLSFNGASFLGEYLSDPNEISPYQDFGIRISNYFDSTDPGLTVTDLLGDKDISLTKVIVSKELPYLSATLSQKVVVIGGKFSGLSDTLRHKVILELIDNLETSLVFSINIPALSGKRITISYEPATPSDSELINLYGDIFSVPAYLLKLVPVLKMEGQNIALGGAVGMGNEQTFAISFQGPNLADRVENKVIAGDYSAITILSPNTRSDPSSNSLLSKRMETLMQNSAVSESSAISIDDLLGEMLYIVGLSYFKGLTLEEEFVAKVFKMAHIKPLSEAMTTSGVTVNTLFGVPKAAREGGLIIDVDRNTTTPFSLSGDNNRIKDFMILAGLSSSALEHLILESFWEIPSVSAVQLLKYASSQGIPIYTINSANANQILPLLQISPDVMADIQNATNSGQTVTISQTEVLFNDWKGIGYIIIDPATGSGAYMISGGLSGGGTSETSSTSQRTKASFKSVIISIYLRSNAVRVSRGVVGSPYAWGKESPDEGFDCSGLITWAFGFTKRYSASGLYEASKKNEWLVPYEERLPGDILFMNNQGHAGIYGGGDIKKGEQPVSLTWPIGDSVGEAVCAVAGRCTRDTTANTLNYTGETVIHASGNQAGTKGFMRVVEVPLDYVAGSLNKKEVSRPTGSK